MTEQAVGESAFRHLRVTAAPGGASVPVLCGSGLRGGPVTLPGGLAGHRGGVGEHRVGGAVPDRGGGLGALGGAERLADPADRRQPRQVQHAAGGERPLRDLAGRVAADPADRFGVAPQRLADRGFPVAPGGALICLVHRRRVGAAPGAWSPQGDEGTYFYISVRRVSPALRVSWRPPW